MKISFFEEFEQFEKLKLLNFKVDLYIAAKSVKEFNKIKEKLSRFSNIGKIYYWPVLELREGYWMSAFCRTKGLLRIIRDLEKAEKMDLLWDAELPLLRARLLLNFFEYFRNRRLIKKFIYNTQHNVEIATYPFTNKLQLFLAKLFCLYFEGKTNIPMLYSTEIKRYFDVNMVRYMKKCVTLTHSNKIGVGTLTKGIKKDEQSISAKQLERDLQTARKLGVNAIIYSLRGLNKGYLKIIGRFAE